MIPWTALLDSGEKSKQSAVANLGNRARRPRSARTHLRRHPWGMTGCAGGAHALRWLPQETSQDRLDRARAEDLLQRCRQPGLGMFLPVPPDQVAVARELRRTFLGIATLDVSPRQMHDDHITVHRLVAMDAKVRQP